MIESRPSRTAERVAIRRAVHQLLDDPLIHDDPLALTILGDDQAAAMRADPRRFGDGPVAQVLRAFLAVRSRMAEDSLAEAVAAGVRQYVVLGAGLDTFAYRNPYPGLRVFEVDHPATQAWKRQRLVDARIPIPEGVTFAAVDFSSESLPAALRAAGLRSEESSFFSWLGVTPYLEPANVLGTLAAIAPFAANGGGVVFDYNVPPAALAPARRAGFEVLAGRVAAAGETFRGFFEPEALVATMRATGFREVRDLGPEELNARFLSYRADGLRVGSVGHILTAIGCHDNVCRGQTQGRDELFKRTLRSLSRFYVDIRIHLEGGKVTPLTRARVALNRVIHRKGKRKKK
jgi:methyltransferase (TIGR00027 family)